MNKYLQEPAPALTCAADFHSVGDRVALLDFRVCKQNLTNSKRLVTKPNQK